MRDYLLFLYHKLSMDENELLKGTTYRDRVSTVTESGKRNWIYALKPKGNFYNYRSVLAYLYLIVFLIMPFIKINGNPLFMVNIPKAKIILFSKVFWPQDFFIFAIGMIAFIIFIVLFTVAYGRLFCGWVCPQTIFMEFVFRKIEWIIEGNPMQQKKLNQSDWTVEKIWKKLTKHLVFLVLSFILANIFFSYIIGMDELLVKIAQPISENPITLIGLFIFTLLFYSVYAYVREIVCTTVCPYGRLQGVMIDKDSMQVAYDYERGDPRGRYSKNRERTEGDCVDCHLCIDVCPTGIDIRNGSQMECVGCTACIDACDGMMEKVNFAKGLIRYTSENQIINKTKFVFNTRLKAYTVLLTLLVIFLGILIYRQKSIDTYITRVKGQLYQEAPNERLSNLFDIKIINKSTEDIPVTIKLEDIPDGTIKVVGLDKLVIKKESLSEFTTVIEVPKSYIHKRSTDIRIGIYKNSERVQVVETTFYGPFK